MLSRTSLPLLACLLAGVSASNAAPLRLWYEQPAAKWSEALPVGNGRLGAMVFGGVEHERLQLNESSVWSGSPGDPDRKDAGKSLPEIRRLLFEGKADEADAILRRELLSETIPGSYQPLGDLELFFPSNGPATAYVRELDLTQGVATTRYRAGGTDFTREVWCSEPDQVLVVRLTASAPGMISCTAKLGRAQALATVPANNTLGFSGQTDAGQPTAGVHFAARMRVDAKGGVIERTDDGLRITNADEVILLLAANTDYSGLNPGQECESQLARIAPLSAAELKSRHIADYRRLFDRITLSLGKPTDEDLPTDKRLARIRSGENDPQLAALFFQYGRYLLISSSRPGELPANLQGIWNDRLAAPWYGGWHLNINVQMNYWLAEPAALSECHEPLFDLLDRLRPNGRRTARDVYGARGFVLSHRTNAWLFTSPNLGLSVWPTASAWMCEHLWDHFLFTQDRAFLEQQALPVMQEAAEFFLDWLVVDTRTGKLVSGPSMSPENTYWFRPGSYTRLDMGPAMDQQMIAALFDHCLAAADLLGITNDVVARIRDARPRLAGHQIGRDGRLLEWSRDFAERETNHRHVSHLWAVFPGAQISRRRTPELAAAAAASLLARNKPTTSDISASRQDNVGWSLAWNAALWARLNDAPRASAALTGLFERTLFPNLMTSHPRPKQESVFQVDANFGGAAAIAEMLLRSDAGEIEFLPALPAAWADGSFSGLRARGGFSTGATWQAGRLTRAEITATQTARCRVRSAQPFRVQCNGIELAASASEGDSHVAAFPAESGRSYQIIPANPENP